MSPRRYRLLANREIGARYASASAEMTISARRGIIDNPRRSSIPGSCGPFIEGAAQQAEVVRETGPSSHQNVVGGFGDGHKHALVRGVGDLEGENQRMRAPVAPVERSADGTQAAILRLEEPAST